MNAPAIIAALLSVLVIAAGCAQQNPESANIVSPEEAAATDSQEALNSIDQTFINESDEVRIGEMI
ncbi:hypothetical protein HYU11_04500 [Candidatus Woesearchaeota archaeon]|nr:hypothetical protein [Candidatus Woesearchaeota archaeon]